MSILSRFFRLPEPSPIDPIDHPDLRRMTVRELADLPFPRPDPNACADPAFRAKCVGGAVPRIAMRGRPGRIRR
jgi:hypothetical protein